MANKARASFEIKLGDEVFTLRPTFEAMMEFEGATGLDVFEALRQAKNRKMSVRSVVGSIYAGIKGEHLFQNTLSECPSFSKVGMLCQNHGMADCVDYAIEFLAKSIVGDEKPKKSEEEKERAQTME